MIYRSHILVAQKRTRTTRARRLRDAQASDLPTPFGMLLRLIIVMTVAFALAMAISHFAPRLGA